MEHSKLYPIMAGFIVLVLAIVGATYWFVWYKPQAQNTATPSRDGKYLGYIHNVDTLSLKISFDEALWLTGKEGEDAAIEAGHCTQETRSECLPNDYFIKNANVGDDILSLDRGVVLFMQTWKMEETGEVTTREISLADFASLINDQALHWRALPYGITIENDKVTRIEEIYIP